MCPSSGEITVSMRHWYLSLFVDGFWSAGWSDTPICRADATHTEWQIPVSHRYSNFSWWWAHGWPKHAEKRNKYTTQNCARSWIYLQDCTRCMVNKPKILSSLSSHWAQKMRREVPADAGILCDKAAVLRDTIKGTLHNKARSLPWIPTNSAADFP